MCYPNGAYQVKFMNLRLSIAIIIGFVVGYSCRPKTLQETTVTRVDTVFVEKPMPYEIEKVREVSVPVYVQVPIPADTVVDSIIVQVPIQIERKEYRDTMYRAVVSGAKVGDLSPSLDEIEVYPRNTITTITTKPPLFAPYVSGSIGNNMFGVGGGVSIRNRHNVGAKVWRVEGQTKLTIDYSYKF